MKVRSSILLLLLLIPMTLTAQEKNQTDPAGRKQGIWIKNWPNGNVQYEGQFSDDKPAGTFKRYYENGKLQSVMQFSNNGIEAYTELFHINGNLGAVGKYRNQKKEGLWKFYSGKTAGYLVVEEYYANNLNDGKSVKYYADSTIAEIKTWKNGLLNGEWKQFHQNGKIALSGTYLDNNLEGKFETFSPEGNPEYSGFYKNDTRDGLWSFFDAEGKLKSSIEYSLGVVTDPAYYLKEAEYFDLLDKNKGRIADPAETGELIWK